MSKPMLDVVLTTAAQRRASAKAVVDTGSYFTIVREDVLPTGTLVERYPAPRRLRMAGKGGKLRMVGGIILDVRIAGKVIRTPAFVSPDLNRDMLIGAETMQAWDISIVNRKRRTKVIVGKDMHDPEIIEVDAIAAGSPSL